MTEERTPPANDDELDADDVRNDPVPIHPDDPQPGEDDASTSPEPPTEGADQ